MSEKYNDITELVFTMNRLTKEGMEYGLNSLSFVQLQALSFIYRKEQGPTMKDLSAYLNITPPSVTSIVNNLIKLNLIKKIRDTQDKRSIRLILTSKGGRELHKGFNSAKNCLEKRLSYLSEKDKKEFIRILTKLSYLFKCND